MGSQNTSDGAESNVASRKDPLLIVILICVVLAVAGVATLNALGVISLDQLDISKLWH